MLIKGEWTQGEKELRLPPGHANLGLPFSSVATLLLSTPPPPPRIPPPTMGVLIRTSEDSLFDDKQCLDAVSLPFPSHAKPFGKRKRAFFATATLVSLLFLASYLSIQNRASDWFGNDLEPIPFAPQDVDLDDLPSNATYPLPPSHSGVRGPPTPLFRGAHSFRPPQ